MALAFPIQQAQCLWYNSNREREREREQGSSGNWNRFSSNFFFFHSSLLKLSVQPLSLSLLCWQSLESLTNFAAMRWPQCNRVQEDRYQDRRGKSAPGHWPPSRLAGLGSPPQDRRGQTATCLPCSCVWGRLLWHALFPPLSLSLSLSLSRSLCSADVTAHREFWRTSVARRFDVPVLRLHALPPSPSPSPSPSQFPLHFLILKGAVCLLPWLTVDTVHVSFFCMSMWAHAAWVLLLLLVHWQTDWLTPVLLKKEGRVRVTPCSLYRHSHVSDRGNLLLISLRHPEFSKHLMLLGHLSSETLNDIYFIQRFSHNIQSRIHQKTLPSINGRRPGPTNSRRCTFTRHYLQEATDPICFSTHVWCKPVLDYCLLRSCKTSK